MVKLVRPDLVIFSDFSNWIRQWMYLMIRTGKYFTRHKRDTCLSGWSIWSTYVSTLIQPLLLNSLFYFQTKNIKLVLQLLPNFFFFVILDTSLPEQSYSGAIRDIFRKTKEFSERNSVNALFLKFRIRKTMPLL